METHRFPGRAAAELYLRDQGYAFRGAPDRWSKVDGDGIAHAWMHLDRGAVVVIGRHAGGGSVTYEADEHSRQ